MGDFKAQLEADMKVFFNPGEFGQLVNIWYLEKQYSVHVVIDRTGDKPRKRRDKDHVDGIYQADCTVHIPLNELGYAPKKGREIEIEEAGAVNTYQIAKSNVEEGEITLELERMDE